MDTLRDVKGVDGFKQEFDIQVMMKNVDLEWKNIYKMKIALGSEEPKMQEARRRIHKQMITKR